MADQWRSTQYPGADPKQEKSEEKRNGAANDSGPHPEDPGPQPDGRPGGKPKGDPRYTGLTTVDAFMADMRPPEYLVDGFIQRGMTYTLTGITGHGKTAVSLLLGTCVSIGALFCGRETQQGSVAILAGENPDNVRWQFYGLRADLGLETTSLPIHFHAGNFSIEAAFEQLAKDVEKIPNLALIVPDTHQAFFQGDNDNDNIQMIQAARDFRALSHLPSRPTIFIPCHPIKNARKDNMVPRGGSAFLNEVDGNVALWCEDGVVELYQGQGKHRGVPYDPLRLKLVKTEPPGLLDGKGRQMPSTVARPLLILEAEREARATESRENRVLALIRSNPKIGLGAISDVLGGCDKSNASRFVDKLKARKWVRRKGRSLALTPDGDAVLDD